MKSPPDLEITQSFNFWNAVNIKRTIFMWYKYRPTWRRNQNLFGSHVFGPSKHYNDVFHLRRNCVMSLDVNFRKGKTLYTFDENQLSFQRKRTKYQKPTARESVPILVCILPICYAAPMSKVFSKQFVGFKHT